MLQLVKKDWKLGGGIKSKSPPKGFQVALTLTDRVVKLSPFNIICHLQTEGLETLSKHPLSFFSSGILGMKRYKA